MNKRVPNTILMLLKRGLLLMLLLPMDMQAQIVQTARYEREQKTNEQDFILISMQEEGIMLVRDKEKFKEGKQVWELIKLDTTLQEVWSIEMDIESRQRIVGYEYKNNLIYLLFRLGEHDASELTLFTVQSSSKEVKKYSIKQELSFRVTHFSPLATSIALGGYVSNEPAILLYDLKTEKAKLVPGFFNTDTELLDLRINTNNTFNTLIADRTSKQKMRLILKTFDASGALLLEDMMEIDPKKTILAGITTTLLNDDMLIAGTWTEGNSKQASGIFSTLIDPFSEQEINYYDFGQLDHFLDYQSPKRVATYKSRSQQAKKLGEIPAFKTYASTMRLEEQAQGFALLTEVYQPSTGINSSPYWNNNIGMPYGYSPYGYNPFMNRYYNSPYQYNSIQTGETKMLHASLVIFDARGRRIQDYGLKLEDKKLNGLEQTTDFVFYQDIMALAYKKEGELHVMVGKPDGTVVVDTVFSKLSNPEEIVRNNSDVSGNTRAWYKNVIYLWGYQNIRYISRKVDEPSRYVFYINKVEIH
jgi:hypothetical protein